jgi:addiction module RelE/StbE family toxin
VRIVWKEQFKEKFNRLERRLKDPKPLRKALNKAIFVLQTGKNLSDYFPVNKVTSAGPGWYDCYLYEDIVMVYKIQGQRIVLATIGFSSEIAYEIMH